MAEDFSQISKEGPDGIQVVVADVKRRLELALLNESERDAKTHALFEDVCASIDDCTIPHLTPEMQQCRYYFQVGEGNGFLDHDLYSAPSFRNVAPGSFNIIMTLHVLNLLRVFGKKIRRCRSFSRGTKME